MSDVPAWVALGWTFVATTGNFVWGEHRYRQARESRLALGAKPTELHDLLLEARDLLERVRDEAGWTRAQFDGSPAGSLHQRLSDYADGVANDDLQESANEAAADLEKIVLMAPLDRRDVVGLNRQVEHARDHLSCVLEALELFNEISTGKSSKLRQ